VLLLETALAKVLVGVAWVPPGVGALSWSEADRFTGTLVGEFDGWLKPPLTMHGGWAGQHMAVVGGIATAWFRDAQIADTSSSQTIGALRLSADGRYYLKKREAGQANLWGDMGLYGVIPFASNLSDAYSAAEQADADEAARGDRARIGGGGIQLGLGAEVLFGDKAGQPAFAVGVRYLGRFYLGSQVEEEGWRTSSVWLTEAAVMLEFFI
jgi:hypothetical protein